MSTQKRAERFWTTGRRPTPRRRRVVLQLLALEDRLLPSTVQVVGFDKATQTATVQPASPDDVMAQAIQELHTAGYTSIDDYLEAIGRPQDGNGSDDGNLPPPPDTRQQIHPTTYPFRAIGRVTFNNGSWCSGAMVSPFDFLTAGHCVSPGNGTWYTDFQVSLAQDGSSKPYGTAGWQYERTYGNWLNGRDMHFDFGLITLDRNVGTYTGWFGYQWRANLSDYNGLTVDNAGYPQDQDSGQQMWGTLNTATARADTYEVYYNFNTAGGQSGSPVWTPSGTYINVVHAYGGCSGGTNCGTRIDQTKYNDLAGWISDDNAHRQPVDKADLTDYDAWFSTHFSSFSASTVYQGQSLAGHTVVQNNGTRNAGAFTTRFYIATNPDLNHTNYLLADARTSAVNAYAWSYVDATGTISYGVPAGRYYLGWYFDLNNEITEFDKSNNRGAISNATFTILPGAVSLSATPLSSSQIRLNWSGNDAGATGYKIERWNGSTYVQIATTNASTLTYTDTNLTAGTQYFYRVRATSAVGDGAYSSVVSPTTLAITSFLVSVNPATVTAGNTVTVAVTARDSAGNVGDGYRGTVSFSSDDSRATLPGSYTFQAGDRGQHSFSATLRTAGSHFVRATAGSITGSGTVAVLAAALDHFTLSTTAADPDVAGTAFDVTVTAFDVFDNQAGGYRGTVTFSSADGGAALSADYVFTAADNGRHSFAGATALVTAGTQDVTATDVDTGIAVSAFVNVVAAAAVYFQVDAPAAVDPGVPFDVTVTALDPYGNVDTNYAGTVTWTTTDPDAGVALPADYTFTTGDGGDNGVHTFAGETILITPGPQDMTATDTASGINGTATVLVNDAGPRAPSSGKRLGVALRESAPPQPRAADAPSQTRNRVAQVALPDAGPAAEEVATLRDQFFTGDDFLPLAAHRGNGFPEASFMDPAWEALGTAL